MKYYATRLRIAIVVYALNLIAFVLSLFVFSMKDAMFLIFFAIFVYSVVMDIQMKQDMQYRWKKLKPVPKIGWLKSIHDWHEGDLNKRSPTHHLSGKRKLFCSINSFFSLILFAVSVYILWEGRGRIVDGEFWMQSGSDMIRRITEKEYRFLVFTETRMMIGFLLSFTSLPVAYYWEAMTDKSKT